MGNTVDNSFVLSFLEKIERGFPNKKLSPEEFAYYFARLKEYPFTAAQWDEVERLVARDHRWGAFPDLASLIQAAQSVAAEIAASQARETAPRRGKAIFRLNGYEYALIVQREQKSNGEGYWAIANVTAKRHGETVQLQKFIGMEAEERIALIPGAQFVGFFPDDSRLAWRGEMPTAEELAAYHEETRDFLARVEADKNRASESGKPRRMWEAA